MIIFPLKWHLPIFQVKQVNVTLVAWLFCPPKLHLLIMSRCIFGGMIMLPAKMTSTHFTSRVSRCNFSRKRCCECFLTLALVYTYEMRCIEFLYKKSWNSKFRNRNSNLMAFQQQNSKKNPTGIPRIWNKIRILLLMGVPEIGTKNWNSQPRSTVGSELVVGLFFNQEMSSAITFSSASVLIHCELMPRGKFINSEQKKRAINQPSLESLHVWMVQFDAEILSVMLRWSYWGLSVTGFILVTWSVVQ